MFVEVRKATLGRCLFVLCTLTALVAAYAASASEVLPDRVTFMSADGHTTLVGYIFKPTSSRQARTPAVVMMHGRAGAYSSLANGRYNASTLSQRHQKWDTFGRSRVIWRFSSTVLAPADFRTALPPEPTISVQLASTK